MSEASNISEVVQYLDDFAHSVNFTSPGVEGSLGADVAWAIIRGPDVGQMGGIMGRCARGVTPDGVEWPPNSNNPWPPDNPGFEGYADRKERLYGWRDTNRRTNQMLSAVSLYGRTRIEPEQVTLVYGVDQPPSQSYSPTGYIEHRDKKVTDVQKAMWAHEQGRSFYGIGEGDAENVAAVAQEYVNELIREANGG